MAPRKPRPGNRSKTGVVPRTTRGRFPPGVSGNPTGRPAGTAGIAARVREQCGQDFAKLIDAWMVIAFGTAANRRAFFGEKVSASTKDRLYALTELRDTAVGRPKQTLEHEGFPPAPIYALPDGCMPSVSPLAREVAP